MMHGPQAGAAASLGLVPLATKEEQLLWAERIRPHVPHCVTMYNNLVQHGRGHASHGTFYVLNDCPASHAVVWEWKFAAASQYVAMFCLEEGADQLAEALGAAPFVDWRGDLTLHHLPQYLLGLVQRLAEQNGAKLIPNRCLSFTYVPQLDTEPLRVGSGLRVCLLGRAGVRHLSEKKKFGRNIPLEVMFSHAKELPFVGAYRDAAVTEDSTVDASSLPVAGDEEVPVSWLGSGFLGDMGMMETEEAYRRRGLSSLVTNTLARRQVALLGFIPHVFVEADNVLSRTMLMGLTCWKYTHDVFWLKGTRYNQTKHQRLFLSRM